MTQEELLTIIKQTKEDLKVREEGDDDDAENDDEEEEENDDMEEEKEEVKDKIEGAKETSKNAEDEALNKEYDLDNYDDDGANQGASSLFGIGDLISHADPREDPYVMDPNFEDDASDIEDFVIKPTDNLLLAGHVEGDASTLEVYGKASKKPLSVQFFGLKIAVWNAFYFLVFVVYNDVEDALYVHHDILLPSFPLALEWLSYEPGEDTKGNLVAIGTMEPIIQVWDLDLVDGLEPVFSLGKKASKKKKIKGTWNISFTILWAFEANGFLLSASPFIYSLLRCRTYRRRASFGLEPSCWARARLRRRGRDCASLGHERGQRCHQADRAQGKNSSHAVAPDGGTDSTNGMLRRVCVIIRKKLSLLYFQFSITTCRFVRVFDCRSEKSFKKWKVFGEVEKVLWNHFNPFTFLAATETGHVQMIDVRNDEKPVWTLQAHSEGKDKK